MCFNIIYLRISAYETFLQRTDGNVPWREYSQHVHHSKVVMEFKGFSLYQGTLPLIG